MKKIVLVIVCVLMVSVACSCTAPQDDNLVADSQTKKSDNALSEAVGGESLVSDNNDGELSSFNTETLEGEVFTANEFKNYDVTMLNVWATWCTPCVGEMPEIQRLADEYKSKNVHVCGILFDSDDEGKIEEANEILTANGITYTQLMLSKSVRNLLIDEYDVTTLPTTFFIDSNGNVVKTIVGARLYDDWNTILQEVLG